MHLSKQQQLWLSQFKDISQESNLQFYSRYDLFPKTGYQFDPSLFSLAHEGNFSLSRVGLMNSIKYHHKNKGPPLSKPTHGLKQRPLFISVLHPKIQFSYLHPVAVREFMSNQQTELCQRKRHLGVLSQLRSKGQTEPGSSSSLFILIASSVLKLLLLL